MTICHLQYFFNKSRANDTGAYRAYFMWVHFLYFRFANRGILWLTIHGRAQKTSPTMVHASERVFITFQLIWPIRPRDMKREYNLNLAFWKTIISIAPYRDSNTACIFYNLFGHLVRFILYRYILLVLVAVLQIFVNLSFALNSKDDEIRATFDKYSCNTKMKLRIRKMTKIRKRLNRMNPRICLTIETLVPALPKNHFISMPIFHFKNCNKVYWSILVSKCHRNINSVTNIIENFPTGDFILISNIFWNFFSENLRFFGLVWCVDPLFKIDRIRI